MTAKNQLSPADVPAASMTMRAIVQHTYGSADLLQLAQLPRPEIAAGEVLVRIHAAGLDRGTWHLMTGKPYLMRLVCGFRRPKNQVLGRDVAGTVVAVGSAVTTFAVGDEVYGMSTGSFAEYAVVRAGKLAHKPSNLSFAQVAVVPISAGTALQACDLAQIKARDRVLITGASGGVGSFAVQLAKALGAEVTGVCSTSKVDLLRSLGADHVIDYQRSDFADGTRHYDVILDIAGSPTLSRLRRALTPTGTAVIVGGEDAGQLTGMGRQLRALTLSPFIRQRLTLLVSKESAVVLDRLTGLIQDGTVIPSIDRVYPLEQAPEAIRQLAAGTVRGKLAIRI